MNLEQQIDAYIDGEMRRKHIPGLSLAIVADGAVAIERSYGLANVGLGVPATRDTAYPIASITKSFTATAIMLLAEDSRLSLDDPLARFRPGLAAEWADVRVQHLLTHTSGVGQWTLDWGRADLTAGEICADVFDTPLQFTPGTQFDYTDTNFNLLGMIIHQLAGKPYDEFLRERVFAPLGMAATHHNDVRTIVANRAAGYDWADDGLVSVPHIEWNHINQSADIPANGANGSLLSSVADLLKWDTALSAGRVLPRATLRQMWTPRRLPDGSETPYGFGWWLIEHQGSRVVTHGGGLPGFTSSLMRFMDGRLTVIILTNQDSKPWDMAKEIAGFCVPALGILGV